MRLLECLVSRAAPDPSGQRLPYTLYPASVYPLLVTLGTPPLVDECACLCPEQAENEKLRTEARRKRNECVRRLVAHVKKRDPRVGGQVRRR